MGDDENDVILFKFSYLILLLSGTISVFKSYSKIKNDPKNYFGVKDKILMSLYHFLYKYLPEYSISITDFMSKLIGKSCKKLCLIVIILLNKLPLFNKFFSFMINEEDNFHSTELNWEDIVKALLNTVSIILFSWNGYKFHGKSL